MKSPEYDLIPSRSKIGLGRESGASGGVLLELELWWCDTIDCSVNRIIFLMEELIVKVVLYIIKKFRNQ